MFYNVASSTSSEPEVCIRLVTSRKSRIQVMLDKEDGPEFYDKLLNDNEMLTHFIKYRELITGKVKGSDSPSIQGHQSSD